MGGDGGQVIDRGTMVKTKGWNFTKAAGGRYANSLGEMANYVQMVSEDRGLGPLERHRVRMSSCWLSQEAFREPVVACRLGNLYNKEALIGALLKRAVPPEIAHVRALKDVRQCLLTWAEGKGSGESGGGRRIVCPVSREELDTGGARAVVIWTTGAVISAKSLAQLKLRECPLTGKAFDAEKDVVTLAPDAEELAKLRERLPAAKKRKAAPAAGDAPAIGDGAAEPSSSTTASSGAPGDGKAAPSPAAADGIANPGAQPSDSAGASASRQPASSKAPAAEKSSDKDAQRNKAARSSGVYKSLFNPDLADGLSGTRDGFGTPAYNCGTRI